MEITLQFSDKEENELRKAAKDVELNSYCKATIMWRVIHENKGSYPIKVQYR